MRILVTGSRNWTDSAEIYSAISSVIMDAGMPSNVIIIHGGAPGADTLASEFAKTWQYQEQMFPANWNEFGRGAGPIRNQQMVDSGADICLAFFKPGSKGTADCVKRAEKAGIPVRKFFDEN